MSYIRYRKQIDFIFNFQLSIFNYQIYGFKLQRVPSDQPYQVRRAGESVRHGTGQWRAVAQATESPGIHANHRQPCGRGSGIDLHRREPA